MWYGTFDKVDFVLILVLSLGYIWMTWRFERLGQREENDMTNAVEILKRRYIRGIRRKISLLVERFKLYIS